MKSATGLTGSGLRDWVVQRISAVVLLAYFIVIMAYLLCGTDAGYEGWTAFMLSTPMKVFSLVALLSLIGHAWVGMWTVFTDYITPQSLGSSAGAVRLLLQSAMIIALIAYVVWGFMIFFV